MKQKTYKAGAVLALTALLLVGGAGKAWADDEVVSASSAAGAGSTVLFGQQVSPSAQQQPPQSPTTGSTVQELQQLVKANALFELRTSYNGSFGASLLFYPREMSYYVAMFQQKNFWRVVKTQSEARAEAIFTSFSKETQSLAEVEIRRAKLEAQKEYTERMITSSEGRLNQLQTDLAIQRQSQQQAAAKQKVAREQAVVLDNERRSALTKLDSVRRQIRQLEVQNDQGLPSVR
ncbi:DUF2968 domain-containing protein [Crenobacter sp. SG2303]|uniref:DUF2968 domain-containing protein n=1 Tax=Crenobacter oryzisoli TaxID=3056844 RepID=A0ABT7XTI1_9NEIS|nr:MULTISPECIES: DUF2968 domain-containing protein [unclassified Crenobacter]MDN0077104.1 DUF2968 domain-containing protein [Crenobacter sp. SG2303]MDN0085059.1 DUF2968 domain-containing protein [Crenobacter sp. SG2305]